MKQHEEVTFQTLANNEDIQIGYSDNDIVVVLWSLIVFSSLPRPIPLMWL